MASGFRVKFVLCRIDVYACLQRSQKKAVDEAVLELPVEQFGHPKAPAGTWGSCIRIVDPIEVSSLVFLHRR